MENKAVYKLKIPMGRSQDLEGFFVEDKDKVEFLLKSKIEVYFGEIAGKHSEVIKTINPGQIVFVSDNSEVIKVIKDHDLESGLNPFDYTTVNMDRNDLDDLTVREVVEILMEEKRINEIENNKIKHKKYFEFCLKYPEVVTGGVHGHTGVDFVESLIALGEIPTVDNYSVRMCVDLFYTGKKQFEKYNNLFKEMNEALI